MSICPDCNGTGKYVGLTEVEPCRTCGKALEASALPGEPVPQVRQFVTPHDGLNFGILLDQRVVDFWEKLGDLYLSRQMEALNRRIMGEQYFRGATPALIFEPPPSAPPVAPQA